EAAKTGRSCLLAAFLIEAEQIPALAHMRGHRRGNIYHAPGRVRDTDAARMEMQSVLNAAGKIPVGVGLEIFGIADDRTADIGRMDPQLVSATGMRLHFKPSHGLRRLFDDTIIGNRVIRARLAMSGDPHP